MSLQLSEEYVQARRVLLDALEALGDQLDSVIVAGAQAIYLQVGPGTLPVADFTTDGDLAVDPAQLVDDPTLASLMEAGGFGLKRFQGHEEPGIWEKAVSVHGVEVMIPIDLIVPSGAAPPGGTRGARLGAHGKRAARKTAGLEAALVDNDMIRVEPLAPDDRRAITVKVAGPASLIVAKTHKINDRVESGREDRLSDKDASDILRLMQRFAVVELVPVFETLLEHPIAGPATAVALGAFSDLFGTRRGKGVQMAVQSLRLAMPAPRVEAICFAYAAELAEAMSGLSNAPGKAQR